MGLLRSVDHRPVITLIFITIGMAATCTWAASADRAIAGNAGDMQSSRPSLVLAVLHRTAARNSPGPGMTIEKTPYNHVISGRKGNSTPQGRGHNSTTAHQQQMTASAASEQQSLAGNQETEGFSDQASWKAARTGGLPVNSAAAEMLNPPSGVRPRVSLHAPKTARRRRRETADRNQTLSEGPRKVRQYESETDLRPKPDVAFLPATVSRRGETGPNYPQPSRGNYSLQPSRGNYSLQPHHPEEADHPSLLSARQEQDKTDSRHPETPTESAAAREWKPASLSAVPTSRTQSQPAFGVGSRAGLEKEGSRVVHPKTAMHLEGDSGSIGDAGDDGGGKADDIKSARRTKRDTDKREYELHEGSDDEGDRTRKHIPASYPARRKRQSDYDDDNDDTTGDDNTNTSDDGDLDYMLASRRKRRGDNDYRLDEDGLNFLPSGGGQGARDRRPLPLEKQRDKRQVSEDSNEVRHVATFQSNNGSSGDEDDDDEEDTVHDDSPSADSSHEEPEGNTKHHRTHRDKRQTDDDDDDSDGGVKDDGTDDSKNVDDDDDDNDVETDIDFALVRKKRITEQGGILQREVGSLDENEDNEEEEEFSRFRRQSAQINNDSSADVGKDRSEGSSGGGDTTGDHPPAEESHAREGSTAGENHDSDETTTEPQKQLAMKPVLSRRRDPFVPFAGRAETHIPPAIFENVADSGDVASTAGSQLLGSNEIEDGFFGNMEQDNEMQSGTATGGDADSSSFDFEGEQMADILRRITQESLADNTDFSTGEQQRVVDSSKEGAAQHSHQPSGQGEVETEDMAAPVRVHKRHIHQRSIHAKQAMQPKADTADGEQQLNYRKIVDPPTEVARFPRRTDGSNRRQLRGTKEESKTKTTGANKSNSKIVRRRSPKPRALTSGTFSKRSAEGPNIFPENNNKNNNDSKDEDAARESKQGTGKDGYAGSKVQGNGPAIDKRLTRFTASAHGGQSDSSGNDKTSQAIKLNATTKGDPKRRHSSDPQSKISVKQRSTEKTNLIRLSRSNGKREVFVLQKPINGNQEVFLHKPLIVERHPRSKLGSSGIRVEDDAESRKLPVEVNFHDSVVPLGSASTPSRRSLNSRPHPTIAKKSLHTGVDTAGTDSSEGRKDDGESVQTATAVARSLSAMHVAPHASVAESDVASTESTTGGEDGDESLKIFIPSTDNVDTLSPQFSKEGQTKGKTVDGTSTSGDIDQRVTNANEILVAQPHREAEVDTVRQEDKAFTDGADDQARAVTLAGAHEPITDTHFHVEKRQVTHRGRNGGQNVEHDPTDIEHDLTDIEHNPTDVEARLTPSVSAQKVNVETISAEIEAKKNQRKGRRIQRKFRSVRDDKESTNVTSSSSANENDHSRRLRRSTVDKDVAEKNFSAEEESTPRQNSESNVENDQQRLEQNQTDQVYLPVDKDTILQSSVPSNKNDSHSKRAETELKWKIPAPFASENKLKFQWHERSDNFKNVNQNTPKEVMTHQQNPVLSSKEIGDKIRRHRRSEPTKTEEKDMFSEENLPSQTNSDAYNAEHGQQVEHDQKADTRQNEGWHAKPSVTELEIAPPQSPDADDDISNQPSGEGQPEAKPSVTNLEIASPQSIDADNDISGQESGEDQQEAKTSVANLEIAFPQSLDADNDISGQESGEDQPEAKTSVANLEIASPQSPDADNDISDQPSGEGHPDTTEETTSSSEVRTPSQRSDPVQSGPHPRRSKQGDNPGGPLTGSDRLRRQSMDVITDIIDNDDELDDGDDDDDDMRSVDADEDEDAVDLTMLLR